MPISSEGGGSGSGGGCAVAASDDVFGSAASGPALKFLGLQTRFSALLLLSCSFGI